MILFYVTSRSFPGENEEIGHKLSHINNISLGLSDYIRGLIDNWVKLTLTTRKEYLEKFH